MGRNAAGESFLRGFLLHSKANEFWAQIQKPEHGQSFAATVSAMGRAEPVKVVNKTSLAALAQAGLIYHPGPGIGEHAYHRALSAPSQFTNPNTAWSLCGITHTTSSAGAMDALVQLINAPLQAWDAVICTSHAVKDNVQKLLQAQVNYLQERLGTNKLVLPQLPVIPLGIHTQDFDYTEAQKFQARSDLGADANTLIALYMGRLSFHAKAHPLAMYQALEIAAQATGKKVLLVECGWHANEFIQKAYEQAAQLACPHVKVITLDGRQAQDRLTAWAGADIFCSLSDNIQETFGIVPIEAMAAGLPLVVSDWDGYKDTVRDGVDGFRIPTFMPDNGLGKDLAMRHALEVDSYDMYCGQTCSLVAVDVLAAAAAFSKLFNSAVLRLQMGQAGRERVRSVYDWAHVISQYEALWQQLTHMRLEEQAKQTPQSHAWPARMDPFYTFAAYPTQVLKAQTLLTLSDTSAATAFDRVLSYKQLNMVNFATLVIPTDEEIFSVLQVAENGILPAIDLVKNLPQERQAFVFRSLAWLLKLGVLKLAP